ncbi:winged helix-turn-helix transcriptional regulator [Nitratireductor mangrovi]|uniref:Winged helix-turn-helix transcriptional regulator n=1 Tax=Nitratireductor mangrovi TaxID=2599600 RepID=A0A5B8KZ65_9HYPH|nr:winged helix-turn-helix domain-containing protein [Nitratireductor mangrovi]QDZ00945.1 winged helix-turn-helix transcriptional regulator [Nitratireductor mangrovi]
MSAVSGDQLLKALSALANPVRLQVIAALATGGRNYVSQLAREIGISRPLLHMHLARLEAAGLVSGTLEVSDDGKAHNYFVATDFAFTLTPQAIAQAATTLSGEAGKASKENRND